MQTKPDLLKYLSKNDISKYFTAEKNESYIFLLVGVVGVVLGLIFFFYNKTPFYKGMAIPMALVGLLLATVGYNVLVRSPKDIERVTFQLENEPVKIKTEEQPRMEVVMKNFITYRYTEIALAIIGIVLFFFFRNNATQQFWAGLGMGLCIMAILALTADYFAEQRGHLYNNKIKEVVAVLG
jgi:ABC-type Fe3+-siderophore transport system permease subunit